MIAHICNVISRQQNLGHRHSEVGKEVVPKTHQSALANSSKRLEPPWSVAMIKSGFSSWKCLIMIVPVSVACRLVFGLHPSSADQPPRHLKRPGPLDDHPCAALLPFPRSVSRWRGSVHVFSRRQWNLSLKETIKLVFLDRRVIHRYVYPRTELNHNCQTGDRHDAGIRLLQENASLPRCTEAREENCCPAKCSRQDLTNVHR